MLAALPLVLAACSGSTVADLALPPPASLVAPCPRPVLLPERALSQVEVERFWGRDRSALRACGEQVDGLAGGSGRKASATH